MCPAPIGERLGFKVDARQKLGSVRVRGPDELIKVTARGLGGRLAVRSPARGAVHGRGRCALGGGGRGADKEGPVQGNGLSAFVFIAPELDEFDGVAARRHLDGHQRRHGEGRGVAGSRDLRWHRHRHRHWGCGRGRGRGGSGYEARRERVGWVGRVSRSGSVR